MSADENKIFDAVREGSGAFKGLTRNERQGVMLGLCKDSLAPYTRIMYPPFERSKHHEIIFSKLEQVERGEIDRLIINMPPRHSKSLIASQMLPSWFLGRNPDKRVIIATYAQDLADDFGRRIKMNIGSELHRAIFPKSELSMDSRSIKKFSLTAGGEFIAVGVGGGATGKGGDLILVDDPIKGRQEANSKAVRKRLHEWWGPVLYTRQMPGARIVIIQTRWHEDDLAGFVLREHKDDGWEVLSLPAIATHDEGWRQEGEALWPEWFPINLKEGEGGTSLSRIRSAIGINEFECLYQQRTAPPDGNIFKENWYTENSWKQIDEANLNKIIMIDPASSKKIDCDFTAMVVLGLSEDRHVHVLDVVHDRLELTGRARELFRLHRKWKPVFVGYEQYGMQADIAYMKEKMRAINHRFTITPLGGSMRKVDRIKRLGPWLENGFFHGPNTMWRTREDGSEVDVAELFRDQLRTFPASVTDDLIDATSRFTDEIVPLEWPQWGQGHDNSPIYEEEVRGSWMSE